MKSSYLLPYFLALGLRLFAHAARARGSAVGMVKAIEANIASVTAGRELGKSPSHTSTTAHCSTSDYTLTDTDSFYDCACGCDGWLINTNNTDLYCAYQSFEEVINGCLDSDEVSACEDYCEDGAGLYIYGVMDCVWSFAHNLLWAFGVCNSTSSVDTDTSYDCFDGYELLDSPGFDSTTQEECEDWSSAFPGAVLSLTTTVTNIVLVLAFSCIAFWGL